MATIRSNADGTMSIFNDAAGIETGRIGGGPATPLATAPQFLTEVTMKVPLTAGTDTAGAVLAMAVPSWATNGLIVTRLVLDITTIATGACTLSAGIAANGTTLSANLITGADVHTAVVTIDNVTDIGGSGKSRQKWTGTNYLTISTASGASAGMVGYAYIYAHMV